jgi:hypothetical protein
MGRRHTPSSRATSTSPAGKPAPGELCGCGKPVAYELTQGGFACNKYMRCRPVESTPAAVPDAVPDDVVERAARGMHAASGAVGDDKTTPFPWTLVSPWNREHWRVMANAALTAAGYAELRAEVERLDAAFDALQLDRNGLLTLWDQAKDEAKAYREAVAGHSERWEAAEAERDQWRNTAQLEANEAKSWKARAESLEAQVAELQGDAERWRFYRTSKQTQCMLDANSPEEADAKADAARAATKD